MSQEQQQLCLEVWRDMLECASGDPEFLKTMITGDETWVYRYDPEMKVPLSQWKHSSSPKSTTGVEQSQGAADCFL
jgi:hypothetical protein